MRKFALITIDQLKAKIDKIVEGDSFYSYKTLTSQVEKDLSKVEFDTENIDCTPAPNVMYGGLLGYHTLDIGLTFFGVLAGGDWESPVFFIIYWDGKKLRGYIPKNGNAWNHNTHEAFGNDDEADVEFLGYEASEFKESEEAIVSDIKARIKGE